MASGDAPSGPSGMRLGGYTLIGIGVLAGVFGVATAVADNTQNVGQQPPPPPSATAQPPESSGESTSKADSATPAPSETGSEDGDGRPGQDESGGEKPGAGKPDDGAPESDRPRPDQPERPDRPGEDKQSSQAGVRVYNNSKIKGLAHRAAEDFRAAGYEVTEVGNYSAGRIYTTTVYFRPGTPEKAKASELADDFNARLEPRFPGLDQASPGVIAVITNDYVGLSGKGASDGKGGTG